MIDRRQLIEYACPTCNAGYGATPEKAGHSTSCGNCNTNFLIPVGLAPRLVSMPSGLGEELTPEEAAAVRRNLPALTQGKTGRPLVVAEVVDDEFDGELNLPRRRRAPVDDDKRVKLGFGKYAEMEVEVDKPTRNAMATTFLGGILVALGVFLAAMFGIKKRS
jgi:hypothetical protein